MNKIGLIIVLLIASFMGLSAWEAYCYYEAPGDIPVSDEEYREYKEWLGDDDHGSLHKYHAREYEEEYGKPDFGGRSSDLPICECQPCRCKHCECHLGVEPEETEVPKLPTRKPMTETPTYLGGKPKVESVGKTGVFTGRVSTTKKKSKMWLTVRTYINSDGVEDHWCDVWLVQRDGAVLQGLMWGHILQERAEQIIASTTLPVKYEVLDFTPSRDSINRPINPQPLENLDELDE